MTAGREVLRVCQAENFAGTMWCGRRRLHWPAAASADDVPYCKPKADPPITLIEMIEAVSDRARDDMASQSALVKAGLRDAPDGLALRKAAVFRTVVTLLDRIKGDSEVLKRLREA